MKLLVISDAADPGLWDHFSKDKLGGADASYLCLLRAGTKGLQEDCPSRPETYSCKVGDLITKCNDMASEQQCSACLLSH